jgi:hypothetical protein
LFVAELEGLLNFNAMKEIQLTKGFVTLVDDEDFNYLNQFKWFVFKKSLTYYATRESKGEKILMHRIIAKTPYNLQTDHIDRNGLNNQKYNLRICTHGQNQINRAKWGRGKYKGVGTIRRICNKKVYIYFQAYINHEKRSIYLGCFRTEIDAARAYNEAAKKYHGEFANLNDV